MKPRKKKRAALDMPLSEALERFVKTDPKELAEVLAAETLQQREEAKKHIRAVEKELEDGARPKRGRFRL